MTENVFIAWGRNLELARAVHDKLQARGYFPHVGGMSRGEHASTFFVNSNVLSQMNNASFAVILAQKLYDRKGRPTNEFRPNLMFEWGYLQARLRADAIHVFLININRDALPSDLQNAYTHIVTFNNPVEPTAGDLDHAANTIVEKFLADIARFDIDGLEILQNYELYRTRLAEIRDKKRAFNSREVGYYLLHMLQPSFYRNDFHFLKKCLSEFVRMATGEFQSVAILINQAMEFYEVTDRIGDYDKFGFAPVSRQDLTKIKDIDRKLQNIRGTRAETYNIFGVILENFVGLCNLRIHKITEEKSSLEIAIGAFEKALRESEELTSVHPSNKDFVRTLWASYIERNLARAYYLNGDLEASKEMGESAERNRTRVCSQLNVARVDWLSRQFELEVGLSKFESSLAGITEQDLSELVSMYIVPNKLKIKDRVFDRLCSAVLTTADAKGCHELVHRLESILGKAATRKIAGDTQVAWQDVE